MKFARDNGWPLHLSCASTFDGTNAITVTYGTSLEDCEDKIPWLWNKFVFLLNDDKMVGFPALARASIVWRRRCFIGDHFLHIMLQEQNVPTTEDDGPPCFLFYAPKALLQLRAESADVSARMLTMCYDRPPDTVEILRRKYWALIASIFDGAVDPKYRVQLKENKTIEAATEFNRETFMSGLASDPYRIGTGKFVAQFKPDQPYSATIAVEKGVHNEYGTAILFEQANRRCLITRRIIGESDEDTFWQVMKDWAQFEPRLARPRVKAGQIFYPSAFSHMFEAYWDFIQAPSQEEATSESMARYESAAANLDFSDCTPLVDVEAPEKSQSVASSGALSRRCPIQDAMDYWSSPQEQAQEESVTVLHGFAPVPDVHNVDTGTGDSVSCPT
jgi:hypothetical protein